MFTVVCNQEWRVIRASKEFCDIVGADVALVLGQDLSDFLFDEYVLESLRPGSVLELAFRDRQERRVDAWVQVDELPGIAEPERVIVGERVPVLTSGWEHLPGDQCLDLVEAAVLSEDQDGQINFASTRMLELLGYTRAQLLGRSWQDVVPVDQRPWVRRQLQNRLEGEKNQYETVVLTQTGARVPVIVYSRPLFQGDQYVGAISTFADIADRKQNEIEIRTKSERLEMMNQALNSQRGRLLELTEELARANDELKRLSEAKSDWVAAVSHDLRTPLTTIMEGVSLVEDGTLGTINAEQKQFLQLALEDANRLREFINDILDLAKIEAGKIAANPTRIDVREEIARVERSYDNYIREKGIEFSIDLPGEVPGILGDAGHYNRILTNLLSNAVKFTPSGGKITIKAREFPAGQVITSVIDTGVGIPEDQKHRIFGKFEQVKRSGTLRQPGSGLGLSLCRQLVELNGGSIGFESKEGEGSHFSFALPAYDVLADLKLMLALAPQGQPGSARPVIFLVRRAPEPLPTSVLATIAGTLRPRIRPNDFLRVIPERSAVILVSAQPKDAARKAFEQLVELVRGARIPDLAAGFYVCPEPVPEPDLVFARLEKRVEAIS
jgi:PAS domain S-box-containing protein